MYPRFAESLVRAALHDTRVVAISGPRQSGKTTAPVIADVVRPRSTLWLRSRRTMRPARPHG